MSLQKKPGVQFVGAALAARQMLASGHTTWVAFDEPFGQKKRLMHKPVNAVAPVALQYAPPSHKIGADMRVRGQYAPTGQIDCADMPIASAK